MKFYLKGHQNYNKSKSKVPKKAYFIKYNGKNNDPPARVSSFWTSNIDYA